MEAIKTRKNKFLVVLIVFMILFSNFGYTIAAIATSDEFEVVNNGFFKKEEVKFNAYFEDENGKKISEITENVNRKIKLVVEILPQIEGYLKSGYIKAVSSNDDDLNFKFTSVTENLLDERNVDVDEDLNNVLVKDEEKIDDALLNQEDNVPQDENKISEGTTNTTSTNLPEENVVENTNSSLLDALVNSDVNHLSEAANSVEGTEVNEEENEVSSNPLMDALENSETNTIGTEAVNPGNNENKTDEINSSEVTNQELPTTEETVAEEDKLVDEEAIIEEKTEESRLDEEIRNAILDINLVSDNEVSLSNIIKDTKIELELEFVQRETLNVEDLCKNIKLQMGGTYINRDLEEIKIGKEEEVTVGWEYTKDFSLESEYTKFSPFELENIKGTIVENKITVTRDIEDTKYLPLKSTRLEVVAPKVNGKNPIEVDVLASKLMVTRGEDTGNTVFEPKNWKYDQTNGLINVYVENENNIYSKGSDEYVIIYRYEDYINEENSNLSNKVKATVTEYSGEQNNTLTKEINNSQDIQVDLGELITYSIETNQDKINKAKIYANYNSEEALYETLFTNQVNVNILTSDILEQLKIDCSKEVYKDSNNVEFEAQGIEYKKVKFNYSEISSILAEGGEIVITNTNNETLYILNKDVITKETDCEINLNGANGIIVYANNIAKNGTINFELTKAIKKCNYDKPVFKSIAKIESRISAEVKYSKIEDRLQLQTISTSKDFEESQTSATLSMNRDTLSTIKTNGNVELRVELNNDKETSDLYINPSFEIVFPKYVTSVRIDAINLLNDCGLRVSDFETYTESDIVKMRIELSGTQTKFSENSITKGTNIIINADIEVDDYAPAKEDQIKLYYCNEGVATYQSQTKWSIKKNIPNGILKTTNGFDVEVIKYQAPTGLIAVNGIVNYDGNLSEVKSVKQGTVSKQIPINAPSRIATMELLALNNTENTCSDITLLGRVPFKGNKDVISNEDLATTTDCKMLDSLKEDIQNGNTATIYYSTNPTANKDLTDGNNGWVTTMQDMSTVKSYMIVVKGEVEAGAVLRYTYDFEIPENLPYEAKITGSFGAFYNNRKEEAVVYETSSADHVVLETEAGPKIEAKLSVDIGDGNEVGEARFLTYTLKVTNIGSIDAENLKITAPIPNNTILYEYDSASVGMGNNNYVPTLEQKENYWELEELNAGQTEEFEYMVKTKTISNSEDVFIKSKAKVETENLGIAIESNETSNQIKKSNLDLTIFTYTYGSEKVGKEHSYNITALNISGYEQNNVKVSCKLPNEVKYKETKLLIPENCKYNSDSLVYDESNNTINFVIEKMAIDSLINIEIVTDVIRGSNNQTNFYMNFITEDGKEEKTTNCPMIFEGPILEVTQVANTESILEGEYAEFAIQIINNGREKTSGLIIKDEISEYLDNVEARYSGSSTGMVTLNEDNNIEGHIIDIQAKGKIVLTISGQAKDLKEGLKVDKILNRAIISGDYIDEIDTGIAEITLKENPNKPVEEEKKDDFEYIVNGDVTDNEITDDSNNNTDNQNPINNNANSEDNSSSVNSSENPNSTTDNVNKENNAIQNSVTVNQQSNQTSDENTNSERYSISGRVWLDSNQDGKIDEEEERLATIKIQLLKNGKMIKAVTSDGNGQYEFNVLENGKYTVIFLYDGEKYTTTHYKKQEFSEDINSDAIEVEVGKAITTDMELENSNLTNIDLGLKIKDTFDLAIGKYITKVSVKTDKNEKEYNFKNEKLAKVEIRAKEIDTAIVNFEYKIIVENVGLTEGRATKILDKLPEGMSFNEKQNEGWYLGSDGDLYNETLKDYEMKPGEMRELKLVLSKQMNGENTGVVSNKAVIKESSGIEGLVDNVDNNVSTQEVILTISTGMEKLSIVISIIVAILLLTIYINKNRIYISFNKKYSNDSNTTKKIKIRKVYK